MPSQLQLPARLIRDDPPNEFRRYANTPYIDNGVYDLSLPVQRGMRGGSVEVRGEKGSGEKLSDLTSPPSPPSVLECLGP